MATRKWLSLFAVRANLWTRERNSGDSDSEGSAFSMIPGPEAFRLPNPCKSERVRGMVEKSSNRDCRIVSAVERIRCELQSGRGGEWCGDSLLFGECSSPLWVYNVCFGTLGSGADFALLMSTGNGAVPERRPCTTRKVAGATEFSSSTRIPHFMRTSRRCFAAASRRVDLTMPQLRRFGNAPKTVAMHPFASTQPMKARRVWRKSPSRSKMDTRTRWHSSIWVGRRSGTALKRSNICGKSPPICTLRFAPHILIAPGRKSLRSGARRIVC